MARDTYIIRPAREKQSAKPVALTREERMKLLVIKALPDVITQIEENRLNVMRGDKTEFKA